MKLYAFCVAVSAGVRRVSAGTSDSYPVASTEMAESEE